MDPVEEYRMPLLEHLHELRDRLIKALAALIIAFFTSFFFSGQIFDWLVAPMDVALALNGRGTLAMMDTAEGFMVQMKISGFAALFFSSPVLFWQVWRFISPGLYTTEKRWVGPLVTASTTLFLSGGGFAYYVIFPFSFPVMLAVPGEKVEAVLSIDKYLTFATTIIVAFGISFQLPVVVWVLARIGLIDHIDMIKGFRYSIVFIFILAAILTPPNWFDQVLMAVPLVVLYLVGIVVARFATTKVREPATE